jgi:hypothetical protein
MNLTLHIIRKDLLRLRPAIVLWTLFLGVQVLASHWLLSHATIDANWFTTASMLYNLLLAIGLFVTYFLVATLVIEDPLMGTDMFWATRPLASGRLLAAKLGVTVLLFGLLPLGVWSGWWLAYDFSASGFLSGALRLLGLQLVVVVPAFAVAALSANLGRFLLSTFLQMFALFIALLYFFGESGIPELVRLSRVVIVLGLLGGTGILVTGWMYRTRKAGRALLIASCGIGLAALVAWRWPSPWPAAFLTRPARTAELGGTEAIVASVESARLEADKNRDGYDDDFLVVKVRVTGVPDRVNLRKGRADVVLVWPDGTEVGKDDLRLDGFDDHIPLYGALGIPVPAGDKYSSGDPETDAKIAQGRREIDARFAARHQVRYRRAQNAGGPRSNWMTFRIPLTGAIAERVRQEAPACRVAVRFETVTPEVLGELPLEVGSSITKRGRVELLGFQGYRRNNRARPNAVHGIMSVMQEPDDASSVQFWILDRKRGILDQNMNSSILLPVAPVIGKLWWAPLDLEAPHLWRTDRWVEAPGWRENYRLAVVALRPAGGFDRQMRSEKLTLVSREEMEELVPVVSEEGGAP